MIHIVTGKMNSGKSSTMLKLYQQQQAGDGFISIKRMHYDKVHGYDLLRLGDLSTRGFVIHELYAHEHHTIACQIGPYLFFEDVLKYVVTQVDELIKQGVTPIYLDEIGMLELHQKCFANMLHKCIKNNVETYITVREDLVDDVIQVFGIKDFDIIPI